MNDIIQGQAETVTGFEEEITIKVTPMPRLDTSRMGYLTVRTEDWTWRELRDYVLHQVALRNGGTSDNPAKVAGIMKRFASTYGANAGVIARYAFEVCEGWWNGSAVTVTRFCKGSDPYFAEVILDRLGLTK